MKKTAHRARRSGAAPRSGHGVRPPRSPFRSRTSYETLPKGSVELEQYADYTPLKLQNPVGASVLYGASQFQTEFEYGITDRLELGLYVTIRAPRPTPSRTSRR